jgi:hypothetical protein
VCPAQYSALQRVAVMSDVIAEQVGINCQDAQSEPYKPGRKRWTITFRGEEIVKSANHCGIK